MSIEEKMYCSDKAKTLSSMKELCGFSFQTCSRHKGCIHPPLVNIKPSLMNCILCSALVMSSSETLYFLDIVKTTTGKNTAREKIITSRDWRESYHPSCSVSFRIWQK